ncbi:cupin domain-containing protein [Hyphomicrobium sp.]|uniref:cupin domain-containing protein n=1 Tax=Hyphomicrobium sp. TaxID=82 RepID=UPI001D2D198B|nr:cupin domain-containing protein [Hyphomicrobium sp.]MBY0559641.1 cupin domain-containing protein [Hyphomicrobium sp.]
MATSPDLTCRVIRAADTYDGKQGLTYFCGIASETVGSKGICMHLLTVPAGARAKVHLHENHETAIYMLDGEVLTLFGHQLEHCIPTRAGDLVYIPAGIPHLPVNLSDKPASAVIARTDPNEQESVVLLPELEALAEEKIVSLKNSGVGQSPLPSGAAQVQS